MDLVKHLGLEDPFLLLTSAAEAVDPVLERAVPLAIEHFDNLGGKPAVRLRPGNPLVKIDQMALVDPSRRRVDDDEHFGRKIFTAPVKQDTRNVDVLGLLRMSAFIELECREAMLSVNDQEFIIRLLQTPHATTVSPGFKVQLLRGEQ